MSEWIEHDGKGMPVDGETLVYAKFADGYSDNPRLRNPIPASYWHEPLWEQKGLYADSSNWVWPENGPRDSHIVAYMIFDGEEE